MSRVGHAFDHAPDLVRTGQRRALGWALGVNAGLLVVEVIGGFVFGSLALIADAAHLVSDVAGLGIAFGALVLAARPVSSRHSFGFARAEVLAAQAQHGVVAGGRGVDGDSQWVRNLRASGVAELSRRGQATVVARAVEVPVADRAPIITAYRNQRRSPVWKCRTRG